MLFNLFTSIFRFLGVSQQQPDDLQAGDIPAVFTASPTTLKLQIQDAASPELPREIELTAGEYSLGESADSMIQVHSQQVKEGVVQRGFVSRKHGCIRVTDAGGVSIEDSGSANGTYVNNRKIGAGPLALKLPVEIRLGGVEEPGQAAQYAAKPRLYLLAGEAAVANPVDSGVSATPIAPELNPAYLVLGGKSYPLLPGDLPYAIGRSERCRLQIPAVYLGIPHQHLSIDKFTENGAVTRIITNWYGGKSASVHVRNRLVTDNPFVWPWDETVELARNAKGRNNVTCALTLKKPGSLVANAKP
ncbi:MAG: FHA domain-containing protein [Candidatus Methylumidiphilus sp.]